MRTLIRSLVKKAADGVHALTKSNLIESKPDKMADSLARIKGQPREIGMVKKV